MTTVIFAHPDGRRQEVDAQPGLSVMQIATANLVSGIIGECGGELVCATCHVFVDPAWSDLLPEKSALEEEMLDLATEGPTEESRLSCQITVTEALDGLVVRIPKTQR
jgi:2Fe-2S ferredoxin